MSVDLGLFVLRGPNPLPVAGSHCRQGRGISRVGRVGRVFRETVITTDRSERPTGHRTLCFVCSGGPGSITTGGFR
jgi:hypothetical protein